MVSSLLVQLCVAAVLAAGGGEGDRHPFENTTKLTPEGKIDELVFGDWLQRGIRPARLSSDAVFVRRVYLDTIGTLPTGEEALEFINASGANKRAALVERLLARPEFADYWAMKWSDLLRIKAEFPINLWPNAAQAYHRWIRAAIQENRPYDRLVRQMLLASGSNFRVPQVNFYRAIQGREPASIASAVALTFMGARVEKWPRDRLAGMTTFFSFVGYKQTAEWKEEIIYFDAIKAAQQTALLASAVLPDGTPVRLSPETDPREVFADWLVRPENPWFTRHIVNRIWYWLLGRGIVHEPDDIRPDNPARMPELLNWLGQELVSARYDLKHIYRLVLNSKTYQLSSIPDSRGPEAEASFAFYPVRRLEAEVLADALCQVTGMPEKYSSPIPEPFTYIPENVRSIALPDASITSPFLETFGRPPRDTGLESERNNRPTAAQRLHMLNSTHIQRKIEGSPKLQALAQSGESPENIVTRVYLATVSRTPTAEELKRATGYAQRAGVSAREALVDLTWALINSTEFLYRH